MVDVHDLPAIQHRGGVEDVVQAIDAADDGDDVTGFARDLAQHREVVADERRF